MDIQSELKEYIKLARQLYQTGSSHDFSHIERVFKLAIRIGQSEGADLNTLGIAALFHDLARESDATCGG